MAERFETIFENEYFVVINKPSGLLSVPDRKQSEPSLKDLLLAKYGSIFTVHRLDKETSGIIVFAKDDVTHKSLSKMFEERSVEKIYVGLVKGQLFDNEGTIDAAIMQHPADNGTMMVHSKGKPSITEYKVLEQFKQYCWVQFTIHTGRTHQIRVHTKHIGNSIACDVLYGDATPILLSSIKKKFKLSKNAEEEKPILNRLALHAYQLKFNLNDENFSFTAEPTKDLRALLQQLRKNN